MKKKIQEEHVYQESEIDLRKILSSLLSQKLLIVSFTGFVTLLSIIYALNLTPNYKATSIFRSTTDSSLIELNKLEFVNETKSSLQSKFIKQLTSLNLQLKVFHDGNFSTDINLDNEKKDAYILEYIESFFLLSPTKLNPNSLLEVPYEASIIGSNKKDNLRYLNELLAAANDKTISDLVSNNNQETTIRLNQIALKIEYLEYEAQLTRLSKIKRIKEADGQKIRELNDRMNRLRYKAKENRLSQIEVLTDAAKLAGSLGITNNSFKNINNMDNNKMNFNIAISDDSDVPDWYLYGEKALLERVSLLKKRTNDDPFIEELIDLKNQVSEIMSNNLLITLESRKDDKMFSNEIISLLSEQKELEASKLQASKINAIEITQNSDSESISRSKRHLVILVFISSFIMSIVLALFMNIFRPDEETST
jgi:LPS O-antigen subunit length determinant protein (WzzB/FepE family)